MSAIPSMDRTKGKSIGRIHIMGNYKWTDVCIESTLNNINSLTIIRQQIFGYVYLGYLPLPAGVVKDDQDNIQRNTPS